MAIIYEPAGKAREYSPLALNLYMSCTHHCLYCYVPNVIQKPRDEYYTIGDPRKELAKKLRAELVRHGAPKKQVFMSFVSDPYTHSVDDNAITRQCLEILLEFNVPVAILTKSGSKCLIDFDLFKAFGSNIQIGASLTFWNVAKSKRWESGAALPVDRIDTLEHIRNSGIRTFASFEPVIEPEESLTLIRECLVRDCLDNYKIGKINNYQSLDKKIDWTDFLVKALALIRPKRRSLYVKEDLRAAAPTVKLYGNEKVMDAHALGETFDHDRLPA